MKRAFLVTLALAFALVSTVAAQGDSDGQTDLLSIGEIRRGEQVTVAGEVTRIRDYDTFRIEDETGRVQVYVRGGFSRSAIRTGETVTVTGWVDDDLLAFRREIYATRITLADGTVLEARRGQDY